MKTIGGGLVRARIENSAPLIGKWEGRSEAAPPAMLSNAANLTP